MTKLSIAEIEEWKKRHIPYRMRLLDGLRWWCEFRMSSRTHQDLTLIVNDQRVCASVLTNGTAESGLMACRFLLEFLGLKPREDDNSPSGYDLEAIPDKSRRSNDIWAERIGCESAQLDYFSLDERRACGYIHKRASQGVGHPTKGPEGADLTWLITGSDAIERAIVDRVYVGEGTETRSWRSVLRGTQVL